MKERPLNRTYVVLAATAVGEAARRDEDIMMAIEYYGRASGVDPTTLAPAEALGELALAASRRGDLQEAAAAWQSIRGPGHLKTPAQYGLKLARKAIAHGELPRSFEDRPIAGLDRAVLERGILDASNVLREEAIAAAAAVSSGLDPEEVKQSRGLFLALSLEYVNQEGDLRTFILANQLAPLIFR